jgi:hypothetical protein
MIGATESSSELLESLPREASILVRALGELYTLARYGKARIGADRIALGQSMQ